MSDPDTSPLRVALSSMSQRTSALLSWHLARAKPPLLVEAASNETPQALFVDADHPDAARALERNAAGARVPVILLTADTRRHALRPPVVDIIAKPVSTSALDRVAQRLLSGELPFAADEPFDTGAYDLDSLPVIDELGDTAELDELLDVPMIAILAPGSGEGEPDPAALARADARREALFGTEQDRDADAYEPQAHLGAVLERELQRSPSRGFILNMPHIELLVLPDADRVYTSATLSSAEISRRTFARIDQLQLQVTHYRDGDRPELLARVQEQARTGYTIDAFLWLAALMSSRGRLARGCSINSHHRLRHWPNLTRLEPLPTGIEIAGCWAAGPASIERVIERTGVQPRFVHAFFTAASALGALVPIDVDDA